MFYRSSQNGCASTGGAANVATGTTSIAKGAVIAANIVVATGAVATTSVIGAHR